MVAAAAQKMTHDTFVIGDRTISIDHTSSYDYWRGRTLCIFSVKSGATETMYYRYFENQDEPLAVAVAVISRAPFSLPMREDFGGGASSLMPRRIVELDGYDRVQLQWMRPGPDGKLVPRGSV
jgi:hypothetical protein